MRKLATHVVEKVWGVKKPPFPISRQGDDPIGELWFTPPPELPDILVKHIFTSERLSVQVHPNDEQAARLGVGSSGKNECWYITGAETGARIAIGFEREVAEDELRNAALDGSIVDLLTWHEVEVGDFFYIPAGTVHAIGAGVELVEIQQNCDITFRLFDYGRPRELHLDKGLKVANRGPYEADLSKKISAETTDEHLVANPVFNARLVRGRIKPISGSSMLVPIRGTLSTDYDQLALGECGILREDEEVLASADAVTIVVTGEK